MPTATKSTPAVSTLKQYIGGKWVDGTHASSTDSVNPADTRDVVARFKNASKADALKAIEAAQNAAKGWAKVPAPQRGRVLAKAAEIARRRRDELAALMTREQGKILAEAKGEMDKGTTLIDWFAGEGLRFMGSSAPSELPGNFLYTTREPLGVVSIITPWNFPWAIPAWKTAPALVAGNAVVLKAASSVPTLAVEMVKIFEEAGLPPGVLNLVLGEPDSFGNTLIEDPRLKAVSFTGSNAVGQLVHELCGKRGAKVTCEMGGKNPAVVWNDADLQLALGGVVKGAFGSTGQRCTATSRLILGEEVYDEFMGMLLAEVKKIKVGNGMDPAVTMGPAIDAAQLKQDLDYVAIGKKEGAKLLAGGNQLTAGELKHGFFIEPTVFEGVKPKSRLWQEEIFGPVLSVARAKTFEQALELANDSAFGLTSAFYSQDMTLAMKFVEGMEAGMVHLNSPTIGGEAQVPFGGVKGSGVGEREMAKDGLHFFTEQKTVFVDYTGQRRSSNVY
jgi:alpha-ketoglutaric semialdehyde dehydrogenase